MTLTIKCRVRLTASDSYSITTVYSTNKHCYVVLIDTVKQL